METESAVPKSGPADLQNNTLYEFTYCPSAQYKLQGKHRVEFVYRYAVESLRTHLRPYATYDLYCELPKPNVIGTGCCPIVHYHGYITFKRLAAFMAESCYLISSTGRLTINTLREEYWHNYITKDYGMFSRYCGKWYTFTQDTETMPAIPPAEKDIEDLVKLTDDFFDDNFIPLAGLKEREALALAVASAPRKRGKRN